MLDKVPVIESRVVDAGGAVVPPCCVEESGIMVSWC